MGLLDVFSKKEKPKEALAPPPPPMPELPAPPPMPEEPELPETISAELPELPETISVPMPELPEEEPMPLEEYHKEEHEMPEERILPEREGPLFVSVQDYQIILDSLNSIKAKLNQADSSFENLNKIKNQQQQKFEQWRKSLEDVQRKLTYVDEVIYGKV